MKTCLYARYSSNLQNPMSVEDQFAALRAYAKRQGWEIVGEYADRAVSGAAGIDEKARPGLSALLKHVAAGGIDQVMAEATDRFARHVGDAYSIYEQVTYHGARLYTLADGVVTEMTAALKGYNDSGFRKELARKIKRGQEGAVRSGRAPAGVAYGYKTANKIDSSGRFVRGLREIDTDKARYVVKVFEWCADGVSPRNIAARLNAMNVEAPAGGSWRASTIAGDRVRKNGMLQNELYRAVIVVNRTSKVTEPVTRKVRIRPNPESEWTREDAPSLRIVSDDLWTKVAKRRARFEGVPFRAQRRPKRLLSGLAVCGTCGGGWSVIGSDRWGCSRHREGGACTNNRTITNPLFEARVLGGLKDKMLDPDLVAVYVDEYRRERSRLAKEAASERGRLDRRLANAQAKSVRLVDAIAEGAGTFAQFKDALAAAKHEETTVTNELKSLEALPVIALHPAIVEHAVELGMPVVEIPDIGSFEGTALQLERQHDVAGIEDHHVVIDMPRIRQELRRRRLALRHFQRHRISEGERPSHSGQSLSDVCHRARAANSCCRPRMHGCDCRAWSGPKGTAAGTR